MEYIEGDLIKLAKQGRFDLIVHGCNCMCTMGAGIAKFIKKDFLSAYEADQETAKGDRRKLGTCTYAKIRQEDRDLVVVNAYTQFNWKGKKPLVEYDAVANCMKWIKAKFSGLRIGLPKIGAGLAGGDWNIIEKIIEKELHSENVRVVIFQ